MEQFCNFQVYIFILTFIFIFTHRLCRCLCFCGPSVTHMVTQQWINECIHLPTPGLSCYFMSCRLCRLCLPMYVCIYISMFVFWFDVQVFCRPTDRSSSLTSWWDDDESPILTSFPVRSAVFAWNNWISIYKTSSFHFHFQKQSIRWGASVFCVFVTLL